MTPRREALDVSKHQGVIDWSAAHAAGVDLCSMRATTGTIITSRYRKIVDGHDGPIGGLYVDGQFRANRANARAAGIRHRLFYHLLNGTRPLEEQADHFLATVGPLGPGEGVLLDYEVTPWTVDQARQWCEYVEARTGRPVAIYGRGERWSAWRDYDLWNGRYGPRPRWLACWIPEAQAREAASPWWGDAWQYTSNGSCPGVGGRVDLSQVDHPTGFNAACGLGADPMPITPPVFGPYGKVADGARYNVVSPQLDRDFVEVHTYESVGDTLKLSAVRAELARPGTRETSTGRHYGVSYHAFPTFPEGPAGEYFEVLDERHNPNASGNPANSRGLHFCLWGRASQTREQWLDANSFPQLQTLAHYIADKSVKHGFPIEHLECVGPNWGQTKQQKANAAKAKAKGKIGVLAHKDATKIWGGTHGDPGNNFPWDVVEDLTRQYLQGDTDMAAQFIGIIGDFAAFSVTGEIATFIEDPAKLKRAQDRGSVSKTLTVWPLSALADYYLAGPSPLEVYPNLGVTNIGAEHFAGRIKLTA